MQKTLAIKIILISGLIALFLLIFSIIRGTINERIQYQNQFTGDIARTHVGSQTLLTPFMIVTERGVVPCKQEQKQVACYQLYRRLIVPTTTRIQGNMQVDGNRFQRNIYRVLGWQTRFDMTAQFDLIQAQRKADAAQRSIDWGTAQLVISLTDLRGMTQLPVATIGSKVYQFDYVDDNSLSFLPGQAVSLRLPLTSPMATATRLPVRIRLGTQGIERLRLAPVGQDTRFELMANWPHPHFDGNALPTQKTITKQDFRASWQTSYLNIENNRLLSQCFNAPINTACKRNDLPITDNPGLAIDANMLKTVDVGLVNPVTTYTLTDRSLKYASLLLLITFGSFFLFEALRGIRIHPIQYGLVGMALAVFYLLLLSFSENIGFRLAYLGASIACISLIGWYVSYVLGSWGRSGVLVVGLAGLYLTVYQLISSEDHTLMMGAVLAFGLLASVMFLTRRLDWYQVGSDLTRSQQHDQAAS